MERDLSLDALLDLDGQVLMIDPGTHHWVRFVVRRVPADESRPHGLDYSLTLHGPDGERLVGYDNAHRVQAGSGPGALRRASLDHRHRLRTVRSYDYKDAMTLLENFWADVEAVLKERGVMR